MSQHPPEVERRWTHRSPPLAELGCQQRAGAGAAADILDVGTHHITTGRGHPTGTAPREALRQAPPHSRLPRTTHPAGADRAGPPACPGPFLAEGPCGGGAERADTTRLFPPQPAPSLPPPQRRGWRRMPNAPSPTFRRLTHRRPKGREMAARELK